MRCVQAIWPTDPVDHEVVAVAAEPPGMLWTGSRDGAIVKWTISDAGANIAPGLFMFGHQAPIKSLVACVDGMGRDLLVSVDSEGLFCSWDCISGVCMGTQSHPELAGAVGTIAHHLGGSHVCFSLDHSQNGVEGGIGSPRRLHALLMLDGISLELLEVWHPSLSVGLFAEEENGPSNSCCVPVLLDIMSFPRTKSSSHDLTYILGVSSAGLLLYWEFSGKEAKAQDIAGHLLPSLIPTLPLPLGAASIGSNGNHILLVSQAEHCLLEAETFGSGTVPLRYTRQLGNNQMSATNSDNQHLAGGVILEQFESSNQRSGSGCTFLLWDWSGVVSLKQVGDAVAENMTVFITPEDLKHFQGVGEGYMTFLQGTTGDVYGIWSKCIEDWFVGVSIKAARINSDAGICTFKFRDLSLSLLASMSLSRIWGPEEEEKSPSIDENGLQDSKIPVSRMQNCQVTCLTIVGGLGSSPHTLVQGYSNGDIIFSPLADYAIPGVLSKMHSEMQNRTRHRRWGHWGPVTCFLEMTYEPPATLLSEKGGFLTDAVIVGRHGKGVLASGAEDGSVMFWNLERGKVGELIFSVHPHIGSVQQILSSPAICGSPWCGCVASVGDDGIISLISLQSKQVERMLTSHPFQQFESISWDGQRGFMACFGNLTGSLPCMVVWDLYSCRRERTLTGDQAKNGFGQFCERVKSGLDEHFDFDSQPSFHDTSTAKVMEVDASDKLLRIVSGPRQDIAFLEIDIHGLLPVHYTPSDTNMDVSTSGGLACALSLLHAWGIHYDTDVHLSRMLQSLCLTQQPSPRSLPSRGDQQAFQNSRHSTCGISLTQGIVESDFGPVTVQVPYHVPPVFSPSSKLGENSGNNSALIGPLWKHCPDFVGRELVCLVSVSKKLMQDGGNETVCSACSNLMRLYAIQFLQSVPQVCNPSLEVLVNLWEDPNPILKETTRVLLASMSNPGKLLSTEEVGGDNGRSVGQAEVREMMRLWKSNEKAALPNLSLGHNALVLIAGAICCVHSRLIPEELLAATAPQLSSLASSTDLLSKSHVIAAAMLADALSAIDGENWLSKVGDAHMFLQRLFDACDKYFKPPGHDPASQTQLPKSQTSRREASSNPGPLDAARPETSKDGANVGNELEGPAGRGLPSRSPFKLLKSSREKFIRRLAPYKKGDKQTTLTVPSLPSNDSGELSLVSGFNAQNGMTANSELVQYKEGLTGLLAAIGALDLQLLLHSMGSRLSKSSQNDPYCILSVIAALSRLLHQRDGPSKILPHLPMLVYVLMTALDPLQQAMRTIALRGVQGILSEFAAVFPMVDSERAHHLLAVGHVVASASRTGENAAPEAVAVYNIKSGGQKKSLSLGRVLQQTGGRLGDTGMSGLDQSSALGIGALSFRRDGDVLAAYCPGAGVLCVWDLRSSWQHRLIKGPMQLEPIKVIQVQRPGSVNPGANILSPMYKIKWQLLNQIAVMQNDKQLASVELHLGG